MRRTPIGFAIALCCCLLLPPTLAAETESNELLGTWYVVVHYEDKSVANAEDAHRWEDKVWVFEPRGTRLVWTEYSELSFKDDAGRYQLLSSGRAIKSTGSWKPTAAQRAEIKNGLAANPQWVKAKTLRGDVKSGYRSTGRQNLESASVIGFSETWEILDPGAMTAFRRRDSMTSGRSVALEGATSYITTAREGGTLNGVFTRDDVQKGTFVMRRAGKIRLVAEEEVDEKWK